MIVDPRNYSYSETYCGVVVFGAGSPQYCSHNCLMLTCNIPTGLLVYDWLLCLDQEIRFIWTWRSRGITLVSLVYLFSRYAMIAQMLLTIMTTYPMSDQVCCLTTPMFSFSQTHFCMYRGWPSTNYILIYGTYEVLGLCHATAVRQTLGLRLPWKHLP